MDTDFTQLLLRLPVALKAELQKEADAQGRKLTQEVIIRLKESFGKPKAKGSTYYAALEGAPLRTNENGPTGALTDTDQAMLSIFRKMPPAKQLALLSLFTE
jgi:hypothetical protein